MDALHAAALEEVALEGRKGCSLRRLWELLSARLPVGGVSGLSPPLQQLLWQQLRCRQASGLQFTTAELQEERKAALKAAESQGKKKKKAAAAEEAALISQQFFLAEGEVPPDVATAEQQGLLLVAGEAARLSVLGVFDEIEAAHKLSDHQLSVLEMAGQRRFHGAVQTDMANELGVQHRNFFYVLKMLEARHMVVRNKLMVPSGRGSNSGWAITSIVHLPRFAPRAALGSEAVFREVPTADGNETELQLQGAAAAAAAEDGAAAGPAAAAAAAGSSAGSYVVRDDATVMQQICDFLGSQAGLYVSESQVKAVLGFTGNAAAHRQWRRLRTRLCKLGCISAEPGLLGDKAISVLRLLKPFRLRLPVVINSDAEDEEAEGEAAADEGADGEDEGAGAGAAEEDEGAGVGGGGGGSRARTAVEVSRENLLVEAICEAGDDGILSPQLAQLIGFSSKLFLRSLPDLVKKYGLQVDYDMPGKALTNRIIAPPHLLEKYRRQRSLVTSMTAAAAENDVNDDSGDAAAGDAEEPADRPTAALVHALETAGSPAAAAAAAAAAARKRSAAAAAATDEQQQQQQGTQQQLVAAAAGSAALHTPLPQPPITRVTVVPTEPGSRKKRQQAAGGSSAAAAAAATAAAAAAAEAGAGGSAAAGDPAAGDPAAAAPDAMELDLDASLQQQQQQEAGGAPAAAAGGQSSSRLDGLSTQQLHMPAGDTAADADAAGGGGGSGGPTVVLVAGAGSTAAGRPPAGAAGGRGAAPDSHCRWPRPGRGAGGGGGGPLLVGGGVSRPHAKRIELLAARLQERGFLMRQEVRRVILNAEQPTQRRLYEGGGPDVKTANRLVDSLVQQGLAKIVTLQVTHEMPAEAKKIEVILRTDMDTTPELLRQIALYDMALPSSLRRDGMRRALQAQGITVGSRGMVAAAAGNPAGGGSRWRGSGS